MAWQHTLRELMDVLAPVAKKIADDDLSIEQALRDPDVQKGLDEIIDIVADDSKVEDLMDASQALSKEHQKLVKVMSSRALTDEEFMKLGALSAAAHALSAQAFAKASTPGAILKHTVKVVYPYVKLALSLGLAII